MIKFKTSEGGLNILHNIAIIDKCIQYNTNMQKIYVCI